MTPQSSFSKKLTEAQKMMVEDGFPECLIFTAEERKKAWEENPPKPIVIAKSFSIEKEKAKEGPVEMTGRKKKATAESSGDAYKDMRWDGQKWVVDKYMIALKTNSRGNTYMNKTDWASLDNAALVARFNEMADKYPGEDRTVAPVKRFKDRETALKRCEALEAKLNEALSKKEENVSTQNDSAQENTDMATKTVKKKTAKKKSITKPKKVEPTGNVSKICAEFGAREGTNRAKLIDALHASYKKMVPQSQLLKKVYGSMNEENKASLGMVLKGAINMIDSKKLKYKIMREKGEKEMEFGLYPK